jgi:hypothetical protein
MARRPDGSESVYELNTNYLDALVDPADAEPDTSAVTRGLAAHAILLSVVGVPAIYYPSLFGSSRDREGMEQSDIARRINREVLDVDRLTTELASSPHRFGMLEGLRHLLKTRRALPGLSPFATQAIERLDDRAFVVRRGAGTDDEILAVVDVSDQRVPLPTLHGVDVLTGRRIDTLELEAFEYVWLRP